MQGKSAKTVVINKRITSGHAIKKILAVANFSRLMKKFVMEWTNFHAVTFKQRRHDWSRFQPVSQPLEEKRKVIIAQVRGLAVMAGSDDRRVSDCPDI